MPTAAALPCLEASPTPPGFACDSPRTLHIVKAAMKLHGDKAVMFLPDGTYLWCNNLDDIRLQDANHCFQDTLAGNAELDPTSVFANSPDAAAEHVAALASESQYFLFKGQTIAKIVRDTGVFCCLLKERELRVEGLYCTEGKVVD